MEELVLQAKPRTVVGKKVKRLRSEGWVPGILYGSGVGSTPLQFDALEAERVVAQAGSSSLVKVDVEGEQTPYNAIVRDVQRHVIKRHVTHIDFQALSMTETVRLPIPVVLAGAAPAAEELGGVLIQQVNELDVECLPSALVPSIEVDISGLVEIGDAISVSDLDIPEGIEVFTDPDEIVVQITYIEEETVEEEEEEFELIGGMEEVEVVGKGKAEEEEELPPEEEMAE